MPHPPSAPAGGEARAGEVRYRSPRGRMVLLAAVLGSGIAFLDATVVNIALPAIGEDLDAGLAGLQWTVNAYALTLAGLLLFGGSLGDHLGRRRVFVWGIAWFAAASLLCALAPTIETLIAARAIQGVGAALLTPGSLALIEATFHPDDRGAAIGAWSGLAGVSTAIGPFLGGWLVEAASWRLIFLINLPLAAVVVWAARAVPESRDPEARGQRLDYAGAALSALGLAGVTYALTEGPQGGWAEAGTLLAGRRRADRAGRVHRGGGARAPPRPAARSLPLRPVHRGERDDLRGLRGAGRRRSSCCRSSCSRWPATARSRPAPR